MCGSEEDLAARSENGERYGVCSVGGRVVHGRRTTTGAWSRVYLASYVPMKRVGRLAGRQLAGSDKMVTVKAAEMQATQQLIKMDAQ